MAATASVQPTLQGLSYEEFLTAYNGVRAEWVNGEVVMVTPASDRHQDLVDFLAALLRIYIETKELGWVRSAPFQMRLTSGARGREPDLLFVKKEPMTLFPATYLPSPPDLPLEVTS